MGKYFTSTQNIFTSQRRVKMWRESKISFPYCTTSVISDLASERSERDTYRGNTIENRGCYLLAEQRSERTVLRVDKQIGYCLSVYMYVGWYVALKPTRSWELFLQKPRLF